MGVSGAEEDSGARGRQGQIRNKRRTARPRISTKETKQIIGFSSIVGVVVDYRHHHHHHHCKGSVESLRLLSLSSFFSCYTHRGRERALETSPSPRQSAAFFAIRHLLSAASLSAPPSLSPLTTIDTPFSSPCRYTRRPFGRREARHSGPLPPSNDGGDDGDDDHDDDHGGKVASFFFLLPHAHHGSATAEQARA